MCLNEPVSHYIHVEHYYVIIAFGPYEIFGFQVKVGKMQGDSFIQRCMDFPHALGVGFVVHRPVRGLNNSCWRSGKKATALDLCKKTRE